MFGLVVVIIYAILSITAPILPIYSYKYQVIEHQYLPPSLTKKAGELMIEREETLLLAMAEKMGRNELNDQEREKLSELKARTATETRKISGKVVKVHDRRYILGTDSLGRDLLARIIYGGQVSIAIGVIGTITSVFIGIIIGALAGYLGGRVDYIITRIIDVMYGLPYMMLVIILMALFGRNILNLFFALAIVSWLTVARVVRGQIISLKNSEFVEAARSIGSSTGRIVFRHLVPNTLGVIVVFSTLSIPSFIMLESFLSFLGLGVQAPFASWGSLVSDGVEGMNLYPWRLFFPAIVMVVFLFAMNFLGDGLRDALDPKSKNKL
jgi:oligopeptide transport system permease protein